MTIFGDCQINNTMEQEFKDLIEEIKYILSPDWTPKNYEHNPNIQTVR